MKTRIATIALCLMLFLSLLLSACKPAAKPVTGIVEDGKLTVWLSPYSTWLHHEGGNVTDWAGLMASFTGFEKDVTFVEFDSQEEFRTQLSQKILSGEAPDVVLARNDEISYKLIASKTFTDLKPYLAFEYAKTGGIKRADMLTPDFDGLTYDGALYMLPLDYSMSKITTTPEVDSKYGVGLIGKKLTFPEYFKLYLSWTEANPNKGYQFTDWYYPVDQVFSDFINYEKKTTHMGEAAAYQCFIANIHYLQKDYEESKTQRENTGKKNNNVAYRSKIISLKNSNIFDGSTNPKAYTTLTVTGDDGAERLSMTLMALIPANACHPQKAFDYIKTVYTEDFGLLDGSQQVPFNIKAINSYIYSDAFFSAWSKADKDALYKEITGANYKYTWQDDQIAAWFKAYTYKMRVPTNGRRCKRKSSFI